MQPALFISSALAPATTHHSLKSHPNLAWQLPVCALVSWPCTAVECLHETIFTLVGGQRTSDGREMPPAQQTNQPYRQPQGLGLEEGYEELNSIFSGGSQGDSPPPPPTVQFNLQGNMEDTPQVPPPPHTTKGVPNLLVEGISGMPNAGYPTWA